MPLTPVDPSMVATVVTHLEMRARPRPAPIPPAPLRLVRWKAPDADAYRVLFRRVGAPWLWFSRLVMRDSELLAIIGDPAVEVYAVTDPRGAEIGLLELDFRTLPDCELSFFGLVPTLTGQGFGRWLMANALSLAWRKGVERLRVHTCTLDSMGHRFFHDCQEMDHACAVMDEMLAPFIPKWRALGYEVIVTADHGQDERGHHGGRSALQQETALYYFGDAEGPSEDTVIDQLQLAPTILGRLGAPVADTMKAQSFLK